MTSSRPAIASATDIAILLLRLAAGVAFTFHGYQKVFQMGVGQIASFFGSAGVPMAGVMGPAISYLELVGGVLLLLGLFLRVVPWLLVCDMAGAILFVHGKNGYSLEHQGYEFVLTLLLICAALGLLGPGRYSVEGMRSGR